VAMGEQNGVEPGLGPDWGSIQGLRLLSALKHPTIHQHPGPLRLHKVGRTCYLAACRSR